MRHPVAEMLPSHELRRIAVAAECDPRTVARVLRGEPVQYLLGQRIQRALDSLGYAEEHRLPESARASQEIPRGKSLRQVSQGDKYGQ